MVNSKLPVVVSFLNIKLSVILKQFENIRKYKLITLFTLNWTKCNKLLAVHISCVLPTQMHLLILVLPFYQGT